MSRKEKSLEKDLEQLMLFHRNFTASFSISEEEDNSATNEEESPKHCRKSKVQSTKLSHGSGSGNSEIDSLLNFHKSFNLVSKTAEQNRNTVNGSASNGERDTTARKVPNSLDIRQQNGINSRKKKRRRRRPNEGMADFASTYRLTDEILGEGAWSKVATCVHRKTDKTYAVKIIPKKFADVRNRVLKEVEILHICARNRYFIQIEDLFETPNEFHLVSEKMAGPLLALIEKKERFTEREASMVTREVTCAIEFLHSRGIAHRDLKPENILCERENEVVPIKICDFDLSSLVSSQSSTVSPNLFTPVGSAEFMAPEVVGTFQGEVFSYDKKCDLWSLGVLIYVMLSGSRPFYGRCGRSCGWEKGKECDECQAMLLRRITKGEYQLPKEIWGHVSDEAKNLLSKLLEIDVDKRLSASEVLNHPWLDHDVPETPLITPTTLRRNPSIHEELSFFTASCMKCTRKMSAHYEQRSFTLSPPGSSNLASRREQHKNPS